MGLKPQKEHRTVHRVPWRTDVAPACVQCCWFIDGDHRAQGVALPADLPITRRERADGL